MTYSFHSRAGKVTVATVLLGVLVIFVSFFFDVQHGGYIEKAVADTATTSVRVLNIPPTWTAQAVESPASTTTSPTNVGSAVTFTGTGTDGNGEPYYLLICKTSGAPTAKREIAEGGTPECNGGAGNLWAVSTSTVSAQPATASYVVQVGDVLETYAWYAFICDSNEGTPSCNASYSGQETSADNKSPFSVNHAPVFNAYSFAGGVLPDAKATWNGTSTDTDDDGGFDTVKLYVCKTQAFTVGGGCTGGEWATSTYTVSPHVASSTIAAPFQDGTYSAYGYIVDEHGLVGTGAIQSSNASLIVLNASPSVSNITVNGGLTIVLAVEQGQTTGFTVSFDVTDNNSCVATSTAPEISAGDINVYRSGVGSSSCLLSGDYDTNDCYPGELATSTWNVSCTQTGVCLGANDDTIEWTCTFPLWYVADPTVAGVINSPYHLQNWLATAVSTDNNGATSILAEASAGVDLDQFMQFTLGTTSIPYGEFEPDQGNASTSIVTTMLATGNTALDQNLYGTHMCPDTVYPGCGNNLTDTIFALNQHFATSTIGYGLGTSLGTSTQTQELELDLIKTTSTTTPAVASTYWGIYVPSTITLSGDYIGVNTIEGKVAETVDWTP